MYLILTQSISIFVIKHIGAVWKDSSDHVIPGNYHPIKKSSYRVITMILNALVPQRWLYFVFFNRFCVQGSFWHETLREWHFLPGTKNEILSSSKEFNPDSVIRRSTTEPQTLCIGYFDFINWVINSKKSDFLSVSSLWECSDEG